MGCCNSLIKNSNMEVLGPEYPLVSRINNFFIVNILLKIGLDLNLSQQKILLKKILKNSTIILNLDLLRF